MYKRQAIDSLSNKLAGSITCPFCGHEFLVAEPQFDIEAGMKELLSLIHISM